MNSVCWFRDFDINSLEFKPAPRRPGQKGEMQYANSICSFDIETTRLKDKEQSVMYVWQFAVEEQVIMGRTWEEFKDFLSALKAKLGNLRLPVFVHNLSYEFVFLSGVYHFNEYEVFCTEQRKILKCSMYKCFEFRCSYKLTNLSLAEMSNRYNKKYVKQSGEEFDYSRVRLPSTPLTEQEIKYCAFDVLSVVESVHAIMELNEENIYSLPLTSTGFVRKAVKTAMHEVTEEHNYRLEMLDEIPSYRCYQLLKSAFRGGNTHANRFYVEEVLEGKITSMDISSSYPSQQCNKLFPRKRFVQKKELTVKNLERLIDLGAAVIMRVTMHNVELRDKYCPVPYIPVAKCLKITYPDNKGVCTDNGRVLFADLEMCITDIDYKIIVSQYKADITIEEMYVSWYAPLPQPIVDKNIEYFVNKTKLKNVEKQELYYFKNKELLNSIYGMSVQDAVKQHIVFSEHYTNPDTGKKELYHLDESKSRKEIYEKARKSAFTQYAYGVWTTAHARAALQAGIDMCGDNLIYCDTDSVKYFGDVDFNKYNKARIKECKKSGLYAKDPNGVIHYGGVYEFDGSYDTFITLGAKRYAYTNSKWQHFDDLSTRIHITVSGVSKSKGARYLALHGGLEAFKPGFIFEESGKTESLYNDLDKPIITKLNGELVPITRNVVIRDVPYTLELDDDYCSILEISSNYLNKIHKFWMNLQLQL